MGQPAARISDMHVCPMVTGVVPHVGGPVAVGAPTVLIGGIPAARVGDMAVCVGPPDTIVKGSATVMIAGMPAARMGDMTAHGGVITLGLPTVLIGDGGSAGASIDSKNVFATFIDGIVACVTNFFDSLFHNDGDDSFTSSQKSEINQALNGQKTMLESKKAELERWDESDQAKFKKAFGSSDDSAKKTISDRIDRMLKLNESMSEKNFSHAEHEDGVFAYVFRDDASHTVYLDDGFWKAGNSPPDTKAGVLTHEMSHFTDIGDTNDMFNSYKGGKAIYGQENSNQLAIDKPDLALKHADSFEYWAEDQ